MFLHACEWERLSVHSRGTGHMSLLSLQAEAAITGPVSGTFEMAYSGCCGDHTEKREAGSMGRDEDHHGTRR